ncbi:hypothetical protein, partial [Methylobacterium crusticola]
APAASRPATPAPSLAPAPARTGIEARREPPALPKTGAGGWLSDLLTRASQDEDGAPAAKAGEDDGFGTIDTISSNIARMIEHPAAVALWERYRRGETNLFTRGLYTAQGQQTFDEIRRRYGAEPEFRRTVDRYVREFERLLGEVSRADKDPRRANAYLTSETGKVYTMLAHASGRFEGA